jgi:hypothetical protein
MIKAVAISDDHAVCNLIEQVIMASCPNVSLEGKIRPGPLRSNVFNHIMKNKLYIIGKDENEVSFDYGNIFEKEQAETYNRLVIGASSGHVDLIIGMIENLMPPFYILYVLVASRGEHEDGRYQSPLIMSKKELINFLSHFRDYFETDGRHNVWIGTLDNSGSLIYDQHNIIYAYGPTEKWKHELVIKGFKEETLQCPFPHSHHFNYENDKYEDEIINYWNWRFFELADQDL